MSIFIRQWQKRQYNTIKEYKRLW